MDDFVTTRFRLTHLDPKLTLSPDEGAQIMSQYADQYFGEQGVCQWVLIDCSRYCPSSITLESV